MNEQEHKNYYSVAIGNKLGIFTDWGQFINKLTEFMVHCMRDS